MDRVLLMKQTGPACGYIAARLIRTNLYYIKLPNLLMLEYLIQSMEAANDARPKHKMENY